MNSVSVTIPNFGPYTFRVYDVTQGFEADSWAEQVSVSPHEITLPSAVHDYLLSVAPLSGSGDGAVESHRSVYVEGGYAAADTTRSAYVTAGNASTRQCFLHAVDAAGSLPGFNFWGDF